MSILARHVLDRDTSPNPLVSIGLSPTILDLGLSEDELFEYVVKDVGRRLVMRFHPDRGQYAAVLQRKYALAYEQLKDRQQFTVALLAFRHRRSDHSTEHQTQRAVIDSLRVELASTRAQVAEARTRGQSEGAQRMLAKIADIKRKACRQVDAAQKRADKWQRAVLPILGTQPDRVTDDDLLELVIEERDRRDYAHRRIKTVSQKRLDLVRKLRQEVAKLNAQIAERNA